MPITGVDVGVGSAESVTTVGCVTGRGPSLVVPLVASIAVGTITAMAAATPRPEAIAAPAADRGRLAADVVEGEGGSAHRVGAAAQRLAQLVVEVVHRSSSWGFRWAGVRSRSAARARLVWDFTVPTETPRASAVSASDSSS